MRMKRTEKKSKKIISAILTIVLTVNFFVGIPVRKMEKVEAANTLSNPRTDSNGVVTWDCVYFGNYPQSDKTGETKEPIKWRVLSVNDNDAFLVADKNLDCQQYNTELEATTWETCTIRSWLNGYDGSKNTNGVDYSKNNFIDCAFTSSEQNAIITTTLENADNPEFGTEGGNNTDDKVFLLSYDDATNSAYGFSSDYNTYDKARRRQNTNYGKEQGAWTNEYDDDYMDNGWWWLRSPGNTSSAARKVLYDGYINQNGDRVTNDYDAVCPALHLNLLASNLWSYAGKVSSDGSSIEEENKYQIFEATEENGVNSWQDAKEYCESLGGHLATITSEKENEYVYQYVNNQGYDSVYFGLSDSREEGTWEWVTGEPVDYTNWHSGEPNSENSEEDYAMYYWKFSEGTWNDGDFGESTVSGGKAFLCEWDSNNMEGGDISGGDTSGLSCKQTIMVEVGQTENINAMVYAQRKTVLETLCSATDWSSSDESVVEVNNGGFIQETAPTSYVSENCSYSLWWAAGMVSVTGKEIGNATITGRLLDGTTVSCEVTVEESLDSNGSAGEGGSLMIGDDAGGQADSDSGVVQFFPASWSISSSQYPVEIKRIEKEDGTHTLRASVGIGRSDLLDSETEWGKYKSACEDANKNSSDYDTLASYRELFGLKSSTAIHSSGWQGSKPSLSVMGYVENQYDKYGKLIKASGCIAGNFEFKGGMSWQFVTPIGPMFLNLEAGGKMTLSGGPSWDVENSKMSLDGKAIVIPSVSLTGGYGIDKVASLSAKGELSVWAQAYPPSEGTLYAEASVNIYVLFVFDGTRTLAKYSKTLWDTTSPDNVKAASMNSILESDLEMMSTDLGEKETMWSGKMTPQLDTQMKTLQEGVLNSTLPMLAEIDGKQVMVWQSYNQNRQVANSTVLEYSVFENGMWSEPKAVLDDGYGDAYADLQVIGGKLYLTWQKHMVEITTTEEEIAIEQMARHSEILCAEFDSQNNSFTNIKQITDNEQCDMMPQFVKGTSFVEIAFVRNDAQSMLQSEGVNSIYSVKLDDVENESILVQSPGTIDRFITYVQDGTTKAMYVTQDNNIVAVMNSENQPIDAWNELMQLSKEGTITSLHYDNGNICAICNGVLYNFDLVSQKMSKYTAGNSAFDANAVYCTNGTKSGYVWSSYDEDTGTGYIKGSMKIENGFSEPVVLYETKGDITRYIAPLLMENGEWNIALNQENYSSKIHSLCYLCKEESVDSKLLSVEINDHEQKDGKTGIDYVFANKGDSYIDNIALTITASNGNIVKENVDVHIAPGEIVADTAYVDISTIKKGQNVTIGMCDFSQSVTNDDTIEVGYAKTDIALVGTATQDDEGIHVNIMAKNQGNEDADIRIGLYANSDMSNKLSDDKDIKVTCGKQENVCFMVDPNDVVYDENHAAYLTAQADVTGGDYDTSNNVVFLALYEGEEVNANTAPKEIVVDSDTSKEDESIKEEGSEEEPVNAVTPDVKENGTDMMPVSSYTRIRSLTLKGISKRIAAGKKIRLVPYITPTDAANQNLIWTSSNIKYASISSKGVVTTKKKGEGNTVTFKASTQDGSKIVASYKIRIVKHAVKSITLKAKNKTVKAGKKLNIKAIVKTTGKTANKTLQWSSSNIKYATVSKKGVVTAKKTGKGKTVKITAMATDGTGKKAVIKIRIK